MAIPTAVHLVTEPALEGSDTGHFGTPSHSDTSARGRLLLMDAANRFLQALAAAQPLVVVLDDLQWADESSLALLDADYRRRLRRWL